MRSRASPVAPKPAIHVIVLGVMATAGCELVAGIKDLALTADAGTDLAPAEAQAPGDAGSDVALDANSDAADGASSVPMDGGLTGDAADGAIAADDVHPGEASAVDPGTLSEAGNVQDVALTGPDGGPLTLDLIDNMESQTGSIPLSGGRDGFWFVYSDGSDGGILMPAVGGGPAGVVAGISPPRGASSFAAHIAGSGFMTFAGMGFDLDDVLNTKKLYDATAYQGFTFWARSSTAPLSMRFLVPDVNTDPAGNVCKSCGDSFGQNITLTAAWKQYTVYYSSLAQVGFGHPNASDDGGPTAVVASKIYGCQFQLSAPASTAAFDVWIDDIYFIKK
jgi:hypothetical protein